MSGKKNNSKKAKMRQTVASLHREMEVAPKGRATRGESLKRTKKRKLLEQDERHEFELSVDHNQQNRLRGSQAASQDQVVQGSLMFPKPNQSQVQGSSLISHQQDPGPDEDDNFEPSDSEIDEYGEDDGEEEEDPGEEEEELETTSKEPETEIKSKAPKRKSRRRPRYRLKNFQSVRMAHRHGDALKYHASGQPKLAIEALKKVARDAPSAPQVYSSLGMVYEDMLKESLKRSNMAQLNATNHEDSDHPDDTDEMCSDDSVLKEQLDFAKKAYGSYHVAAILCKQDFSLWVKAADCAIDAAEIHGRAMTLPHMAMEQRGYHRSEKKRWYSEALGDLKVADNLKPTGIEVPAKLASAHMELGKLSEALTILTDLKNRQNSDGSSSEFQSSYKAWLLYADLMLRIGHECMQWNRGVRTNDNYMFRRWLRKLSRTFDWQERRLQSLALALEAAAGTASTEKFKSWMLQRSMAVSSSGSDVRSESERWHIDIEDAEKAPNASTQNDGGGASLQGCKQGTPGEAALAQFEEERTLLLERNRTELEAFDKTTVEMKLTEGTKAAKEDRELSRNSVIQSHEDAIAALDKEYGQDNDDHKKVAEDEKIVTVEGEDLAISASCRQVCAIASELTKHLHGLELYEGAILIGEAVSASFKERASRFDKRALLKQRHFDYQEKLAKSPLLLVSYEEMYGKDSDNDEDSSPYLSDDDDLDNSENSDLLSSLRNGALPPELRVLFGLALIGEGGRNYVAAKCIEKIDDLEQESLSWLRDGELETNLAGDPLWSLFRRAMTEPLGRTAAYSFLADVLRNTNKEAQWSHHFAPWFRRHLTTLKSKGLLDEVMALQGKLSPFVNFRKNQLLKIIMAANKFDVDQITSPNMGVSIESKIVGASNENDHIHLALSALKSIGSVLHLMWKVEDGNLSNMCNEVVTVCSKCTKWFSEYTNSNLSYSTLHEVLERSRIILSQLCSHPIRDLKDIGSTEVMEREWGSFPVASSWQSSDCRAISVAIYNLAVGCNVSLFSGWEREEFTLKLLRRRHGNKHFGVHIHDRRITGFLSVAQELEISRQWKQLKPFLPAFPELNFDDRIIEVKQRDWYRKEIEDRKHTVGSNKISRFCEDEGVNLFLANSSLCLQLVKSEKNTGVRNRLFQFCLSVLLPISQFCLDDMLWHSDIGEGAASVEGFDEWRLFTDLAPEAGHAASKSRSLYHKRRKEERAIEKKVEEWIKGSDKPVIRTFVKLPLRVILDVWKASAVPEKSTGDALVNAKEMMEKVHAATTQLRSCYSESATEKASLNLAVALLELASHPTCHDPFSCLQQAAMFASQGSKSGNSDVAFRRALPNVKECSPNEALAILGRADCLQSLYFPNEAAFLCSYVARLCRVYRDRDQPECEWNDRWRILAIMAFNVSVLIRTTVSTVLDQDMKKAFLSIWERDVVEELEKARRDGWAWKRKYAQTVPGSTTDQMVGDEENIDREDGSDDMEEDEDDDDNGDGANSLSVPNGLAASYEESAISNALFQDGTMNLGNLVIPQSSGPEGGDSGDESGTNVVIVSV